ncbi:hypothetical protein [Streptomyces sp. cmx-4-9]|uniref:hypothetical protein n=1 Tax=Streptomyces sp. cmx-4-9 TaxID=2790941 RepID=UPI0039806F0C
MSTAAARPHLTPVPDLPAAPLEGVTHPPATIEKAATPGWLQSAGQHVVEHRGYMPLAGRGCYRMGQRWVAGWHDYHPHMIATAEQALAAEQDVDKQDDLKDQVEKRRAAYIKHRLIYSAQTAAWGAAATTATTVGTVTGGGWVALTSALGAYLYSVRRGIGDGPAFPAARTAYDPALPAGAAADSARHGVRGEQDLITALVKAKIVTEAQRAETRVIGQIRPDGPGWAATIELPEGMEAVEATSKAGKLAGALRVKAQQVQLKADTSEGSHEGRVGLWVADNANPFAGPKVHSELLRAQQWHFWRDGIPLGTDARQDRQALNLIWSSILIGGLQDYGKSYLARLIAAAAALDPTVRIIVITGKSGPDWAPLKAIAHRWISGSEPDDIREVLDLMSSTVGDMQKRGRDLARLFEEDPERCPEGKITPELADDGMGPVLLIVDELQELLDGANLVKVPAEGDDSDNPRLIKAQPILVDYFARFVRVARFVLGMGVFVTQRPDADSVPTELRAVCIKRASFRTKDPDSSAMVLGEAAVRAGAAPHALTENSKGVFVLDQGAEDGHTTLRGDVIDLPDFRKICELGRQLRLDAGTLTGDAASREERAQKAALDRLLIEGCLRVMTDSGRDAAQLDELATAARMDPDTLAEELRAAGVIRPEKVNIPGKGRLRGYDRACLEVALKAL